MPIVDAEMKQLALRAFDERRQRLNAAEFAAAVERDFTLADIRAGAARDGVRAWLNQERWPFAPNQPALYTITADNVETANALAAAFPRGRRQDRGYSVPRQNEPDAETVALYVGSSEGVVARLREHLWRSSNTTYALNLHRWCPDHEGSIRVKVQAVPGDPDRVLRQDFEDAVWARLTPWYGKFGGR